MADELYSGGEWVLGKRVETSGGEVAWEVFGEGPAVVLVHGTPSNSYLWRRVVPVLAERFSVYVYDLPGFGESEKAEGREVSIAAQARVLRELLGAWGLEEPMVAGHDIGGGVALRAHLLEGVRFRRMALLDAVAISPWGTTTLRHVKSHMEAYRTMPLGPFEAIVASHLQTATSRPLERDAFEAYLSQWRGEEGRAAYLRKDAQLDERDTADIEAMLGSIEVPVRILWGEEDGWLGPAQAEVLAERIPGSKASIVRGAGHFVMEDAPEEVSSILSDFFSEDNGGVPFPADETRNRKPHRREEIEMNSETNAAGKQEIIASHESPIVARTWFGRTRREFADEYLEYNYESGILEIEKKPGCLGMQQFRKMRGDVAEFTTISYWDSMKAMETAHGEDRRPAHLDKDPEYLLELPEFVEVAELHVNEWHVERGRGVPDLGGSYTDSG